MSSNNTIDTPEQMTARAYRNAFLNRLIDALELKNDAALSKAMLIGQPDISKLRNTNRSFSADQIIIAHELTGWSIASIKDQLDLTTIQERINIEKALGNWIEPLKLRKAEVAHHPV